MCVLEFFFIFMYFFLSEEGQALSSEEMKPEPADSLKERMQERSLWPIDAFKSSNLKVESPAKFIGDMFPEKLAIKHTYQVLCFYQDRLKVSDEKCTCQ